MLLINVTECVAGIMWSANTFAELDEIFARLYRLNEAICVVKHRLAWSLLYRLTLNSANPVFVIVMCGWDISADVRRNSGKRKLRINLAKRYKV